MMTMMMMLLLMLLFRVFVSLGGEGIIVEIGGGGGASWRIGVVVVWIVLKMKSNILKEMNSFQR